MGDWETAGFSEFMRERWKDLVKCRAVQMSKGTLSSTWK